MAAESNVYRARPGRAGVVSSLVFIAFVLANLAFMFLTGAIATGGFMPTLILVLIGLWTVYMLSIYPTMRYELAASELVIGIGPHRWAVPYRDIEKVERTGLKYHPTSTGWKLPGFAVFKVYYAGHGDVRMCAASVTKDITLITAANGRFGITPENPEAFLAALNERVG